MVGLLTSLFLGKLLGSSSIVGIPFNLSINEFIKHLLLIQGKGVTWSILVEFRFYFVLPVFAFILSVLLNNKPLPTVACTVFLIALTQLIWPQFESGINEKGLGYYLPIFFMGSLLAVLYQNWLANGLAFNRRACIMVEFAGIISAIILIMMTPSLMSWLKNQPIPRDYFHKHFILHGFLWSVVVFASIAGVGLLRKLFEFSVLRYLGFISFSMYLLHVIPLFMMEKLNINIAHDLPMLGWIMLLVTVLFSHLSWLFIEKPTSKIRYSPTGRLRLVFANPDKS